MEVLDHKQRIVEDNLAALIIIEVDQEEEQRKLEFKDLRQLVLEVVKVEMVLEQV